MVFRTLLSLGLVCFMSLDGRAEPRLIQTLEMEAGLARQADGLLQRLPEPADVALQDELGAVRFADLSALTQGPEQDVLHETEGGILQAQFTVGDRAFKVVPYGAFWADMIYQTERTNTGPFTLWVFSSDDQGEDAFIIDARRSRFGTHVYGPGISWLGIADSHAQLEIDFHGEFTTENRASILLRHAYWEIKDDDFRFLVGQYWDVISPLYTNSLDYAVSWNAGNIGFRRTQVRYERYFYPCEGVKLSLQGSLNQDIVADFVRVPGIRPESSNWPVVEGRMSVAASGDTPLEVGVSGHIGEVGFDWLATGPPPLNLPPEDDQRYRTWSFNVDYQMKLTERLGVMGEFFTGADLSTFLGGIGQGICPCLRVPIRSIGGWIDIYYDWSPCVRLATGFGLDDPRDNDSLLGRTYNHKYYANILWRANKAIQTGFEVSVWKTLYHETRVGQIPPELLTPDAPGNSVVLQWMFKYSF